jgi:hypothetical protein
VNPETKFLLGFRIFKLTTPMAKQKEIKQLFLQFCTLYKFATESEVGNKSKGEQFYKNEFIKLDYNPAYGGYRIDIVEKGTSERFFSTQSRFKAREMELYISALIYAKKIANKKLEEI